MRNSIRSEKNSLSNRPDLLIVLEQTMYPEQPAYIKRNDLRGIRGIIYATLMALVLWAGIFALVNWIW